MSYVAEFWISEYKEKLVFCHYDDSKKFHCCFCFEDMQSKF